MWPFFPSDDDDDDDDDDEKGWHETIFCKCDIAEFAIGINRLLVPCSELTV